MQWFYLIALLVILGCLVLIDYRYKLAFFHNAKRAGLTLGIAIWLFTVWDIFGIRMGIFFKGDSPYSLPIHIIPEFPIEEIFFLGVLTYSALIIYRFASERIKK